MQIMRAVQENAVLQRVVEAANRQYALISQQLQLMKQHAAAQDFDHVSLKQRIASLHRSM